MKVCLYWIRLLTYHAHRRQNILVFPQDRLACPIQHLLRCSKAAPGQGEMQMPPRCNSSAHQLEYLIALVLREVGVTSSHNEFELYNPDDKRVAQLALSSLQPSSGDTVSIIFNKSGWLCKDDEGLLETAVKVRLRFQVAYFPIVVICVSNVSYYSRRDDLSMCGYTLLI